jgi:hypothetical protein
MRRRARMSFQLPPYTPPDFEVPRFRQAPLVEFQTVEQAGVAPPNYHATTIYPEYFHLGRGLPQ